MSEYHLYCAVVITGNPAKVITITLPGREFYAVIPWREERPTNGRAVKRRRMGGVVIEFTW